ADVFDTERDLLSILVPDTKHDLLNKRRQKTYKPIQKSKSC
ncbi:16794_t:CDS:1, partial [Racocetra persica]